MRWLICFSLLIAVHQCRHLSALPSSRTNLNKGRRREEQHQDSHKRAAAIAEEFQQEEEEEWATRTSLDDYQQQQPVVLKFEVHLMTGSSNNNNNERKFYPSGKRKKGSKQNQQEHRIWQIPSAAGAASTNESSNTGGFIHLFLPLQLQQQQFSLPAATSPPAVSVVGSTEVMTQRNKEINNKQQQQQQQQQQKKKKRKANKKKKKKKNKYQHHHHHQSKLDLNVEPIDQPEEEEQKQQQQQQRQLNSLQLLQDDGIPPLLNSLSTDETQQWARWLRCTLCLKNGKQSDKDSALCQVHQNQNAVECRNATVENELTASGCQVESDMCSDWQQCENSHQIPSLFANLPPCPCTYPTGLVYNDRVWDPLNRHHYRWREISLQSERVDIYRPGAAYCIRSLSVVSKMALSAQQCCYDDRRRLLTRGWAAGTPALVSHEASVHLSRVTERLPFLACKGDFSRYHLQRPPDNRLNCSVNPSDEEYQRQVVLATNY